MSDHLNPTAQKIQTILDQLGYTCEVIEFQETTRTSIDAAARVGCSLGQIVKSLIFRGKLSGKPILILTSGANRVDTKKITSIIGESIDRADPEFVRSCTGFAIGGIPPVGYLSVIETIMDEDLLSYDYLWAAAGTPNAVFKVTPQELLSMSSAKVAPVKEV
jgi:prolyl-tRNA editing enzyme YbaK/EbsC (Cys-tRNA(Pro) deacylase)